MWVRKYVSTSVPLYYVANLRIIIHISKLFQPKYLSIYVNNYQRIYLLTYLSM